MRRPAARDRAPLPARPALRATLAGLLLLAACGAHDSELRVEVRTFAADGPPPREGLRLQHVQGGRPAGPALALRPVEGPPGLLAVPDTPPGHYELLAPPGWGTLAGGMLPQLVPGASPAQYTVVRQHTLVVVSEDARRVLGSAWALERSTPAAAPGAAPGAVELRVEPDAGGAVLVRVPPGAWGSSVALQGRFEDGGLTAVWRGDLPASGAPLYLPLAPAEVRALALVAEGAPADAPPAEAVARVEGLPLPAEVRAPLQAGRAALEGLPVDGVRLRIGVQAPGASAPDAGVALEAHDWQDLHEVRVLHPALQGPGARLLRLEGAPPAPRAVQVRPAGSAGYGLARLEAAGGAGPALRLQPGRYRVLVQGAASVQEAEVEVQPGAGEQLLALPAAQEPATVAGTVQAPAGAEVLWRRVEDGRPCALHGAALRTRPGGRYEAVLPAGTWQVEARAPGGALLPPRVIELTAGLRLALSLQR